jgi:hypothetical protein
MTERASAWGKVADVHRRFAMIFLVYAWVATACGVALFGVVACLIAASLSGWHG